MKAICKGDRGPAVEDVQQRLVSLGYDIGQEKIDAIYGDDTARAVQAFRAAQGLAEADFVDTACWNALVDESFVMGDRSLYLRYPNFHGKDVSTLQAALSALGFACGKVDGIYGVYTESAVKDFQANMGLFPDGIAFTDTFDAILRLHHSWVDKSPAHSAANLGFSRAVRVIESVKLCLVGTDTIARNVAGRLWNVAAASSEASQFQLCTRLEDVDPDQFDIVLELSSLPTEQQKQLKATAVLRDSASLMSRISTALKAAKMQGLKPLEIRVELEQKDYFDGSFTGRDAQHIAIELLDALCAVLDPFIQD